jgi:PAS domain S-box-containing protein
MGWSVGTIFFLYYAACDRLPGFVGCDAPAFPYPSVADAIFPAGTCLATVGFLMLASLLGLGRNEIVRSLKIVAMLGIGTLYVMAPHISWLGSGSGMVSRFALHSTVGQVAASSGYLLADILLICVATMILFHARHLAAGRFFYPILILLGAMVLIYACDVTYLHQVGSGTYLSGGSTDIAYGIGDMLLALAILRCLHVVVGDPALRLRPRFSVGCAEVTRAIVDAHVRVVGPIAEEIALSIEGISASPDGNGFEVKDSDTTLETLIREYRSAFGPSAMRLSARIALLVRGTNSEVAAVIARLFSCEHIAQLADSYAPLDSDQSAAHHMLAEVHRRNQNILNTIGDGIMGVTASGAILYVNPAAVKILGVTHVSDPALSTFLNTLIEESGHETLLAPHEHRREGSTTVQRPSGNPVDVEFTVTEMSNDDDIECVIAFRDITSRKDAERAKSEFLSIVSHELRTPLTSMRGSLGLIATGAVGEVTDRMQMLIDIGVTNTDRLIRLISDILDIERTNAVPLDRSMQNAYTLVSDSLATMQSVAMEHGVQLEMVAPDSEASVWADPDRIAQTLTNLLSNAIKFSQPDTVVSVSVRSDVDDTIVFSVSDSGRGIPAEHLDSIFGRFAQVDSADTRQFGGTGLGLAICKQIVESHGGTIWADSAMGRGSTFYFTIPGSSSAMNHHAPSFAQAV